MPTQGYNIPVSIWSFVVHNDIPNIALDVDIDCIAVLIPTIPLIAQVLRMISEVVLQVLADHKSILYGLRFERFGVEFCVELKYLRIVVLRLVWTPVWESGESGEW
ncbi:hypothetical protein Tco_0930856 [Tanacetum coccineum]